MDKLGLSRTYRHILIGLYLLRINHVLCNCFGRCYDPVSQILLSLVLLEQNSCQIRWRFCLSKNGRIWPSRQWWWESSWLPKSSYDWPLGAVAWKWNYDAQINWRKKGMTGYGIIWKGLCFLASFFSKLRPCITCNLITQICKATLKMKQCYQEHVQVNWFNPFPLNFEGTLVHPLTYIF